MRKLVNLEGRIDYGIYDEPIEEVNYKAFKLRTPMGLPVPGPMKGLKFNQFHFFGVMGPEMMAGMAVVDLGMITNGFFYLYDRNTQKVVETKKLGLPGKKTFIRCTPEQTMSRFEGGGLRIVMEGNRVWAEGKEISFEADLDLASTNPLRICSRAGYRGWVYTQKTSPITVKGRMTVNGRTIEIASPETMGLMDWTGGYMRKYTFWNWGAIAATLGDGRRFGMNLAAGVNETGFTENAIWVDGSRTKVDTVHFDFRMEDLYEPWRLTSRDGRIDLVFRPEAERSEKIHVGLIASRFTQLMGTFEGTVVTGEGETIELGRLPGWAEDHYAKW